MDISLIIAPKIEAYELFKKLLIEEFSLSEKYADHLIINTTNGIIKHTNQLNDNCYLLAETNYIDKVYRDSYYSYYSTKLTQYKRNSIRVSIFDGKIEQDDFRNEDSVKSLQKQYLGFIILRPTEPYIIGRSIISPKALKVNHFLSITAKFQTSANSIKFEIEGFPHSSQDTETISCAETTIWSIMEYFSARYPEYRPVLPSQIIKTLNQVSAERQIPSRGLNIQQISFALREFGFGTRIYSRDEYRNDFERLLSSYIESGIPLIIAIENRYSGGNIGHALLCVGHEKVTEMQIDGLNPLDISEDTLNRLYKKKDIIIYDYDEVRKKFVFIDDNHPAYQKATLEGPALHYNSSDWHSCKITYFIAPLYPKIYLEAFEAKNFVLNFLVFNSVPLIEKSEIVLRFFLTSTRSFKDKVAINKEMQGDLKTLILTTVMPKFVWVAELSSKDLIKRKLANGLIIIDATEANTLSFKPLILAAYQDNIAYFDANNSNLENNVFPLRNFCIFENNLKNF
jgi:hypothetical protein